MELVVETKLQKIEVEVNSADIAIVGGGIAGLSAFLYAITNNINAVLIEKEPVIGGSLLKMKDKEFFLGLGVVNGVQILRELTKPIYETDCVIKYNEVTEIKKEKNGFVVLGNGLKLEAKAVIIATGELTGENDFGLKLKRDKNGKIKTSSMNETSEEKIFVAGGIHNCEANLNLVSADGVRAILGAIDAT